MLTPYYQDDSVTLYHGDALAVVAQMPDESVDCVVTSPPYYGLRDYDEPGQYGLEATPAEYVDTMRALFAEVRRVLAKDGTLWLNLGDSYATKERGNDNGWESSRLSNPGRMQKAQSAATRRGRKFDRPNKSLLGIPWRVAIALQDDGWILRNDIIWSKTNGTPESVRDRLSRRHEHVFMFSRSPRYWFDLDPIREAHAESTIQRVAPHRSPSGKAAREGAPYEGIGGAQTFRLDQATHAGGRNPGDVWEIATVPFSGAHFATMPPALAARCVIAGCKPGGVVLDPFSGVGTTGMVAGSAGHRYVGVDVSEKTLRLSLETRLRQGALIEAGESA